VTASQVPLAAGSGDAATAADAAWLADHLKTCIANYMVREGVTPSDWRGQPLSREEVGYFRRAAEEGLLVVTDDAELLITGFHAPKRYRLFQSYDGGVSRPGRAWSWSWRECFTQLAFACELVLDHGWAPAQVALEVGAHDLGAGRQPLTHPVLLAEAKVKARRQNGLEGMLAVFAELAGGPSAVVGPGVRQNATNKYRDLVRLQPRVFVAVAPGVREVFDVDCRTGPAVLRARTSGLSEMEIASGIG
jgi:hypothetical protein